MRNALGWLSLIVLLPLSGCASPQRIAVGCEPQSIPSPPPELVKSVTERKDLMPSYQELLDSLQKDKLP